MLRFIPLLLISGALGLQDPPAFRVEADFIHVPVTVFDEQGRLITNLAGDDFRLYDEGEPRTIHNVVLDTRPVHVFLLLDVSGSIREEIDEIRDSAVAFARAFDSRDRIAVGAFSDRFLLLQGWTGNSRAVQRSLRRLERGYRTAFYDSLHKVVEEKLRPVPGKKVVVVLTDGIDNQSRVGYDDVLNSLLDTQTSLYIVSRSRIVQPKVGDSTRVEFLNRVLQNHVDSEKDFVDIFFQEKEAALKNLAETTGGRVYFPDRLEELEDHYTVLARELKSRYILTFAPAEDSDQRFRSIVVVCLQPVGRILFRTQYPVLRSR